MDYDYTQTLRPPLPAVVAEALQQVLAHGWGELTIIIRDRKVVKVIPAPIIKVE